MSYDDCEIPAFYDEVWRTARKVHRCAECRSDIKAGEKYLECRGKWDGRIATFRQHPDCLKACTSIRDWQDGNCIPFGGFIEWYWEYKREIPKKESEFRRTIAKCLWKARRQI